MIKISPSIMCADFSYLAKEINELEQEIEGLRVKENELENEKTIAIEKIETLETKIVELNSQRDNLNNQLQEKQEAERRAQEEEEKRKLDLLSLQSPPPDTSEENIDKPNTDLSNPPDEAE